jgi:hypothetical protein
MSSVEATSNSQSVATSARAGVSDSARFGPMLLGWMAIVVLLQVVAWGSGLRGTGLAVAVEDGAARVESWTIGEVGDDVVRKAIRTQLDTLPFWATLTALGDFVLEPMSLAVRAILATTMFCAVAALSGRSVQFDATLISCVWLQGIWVLGVAVRVGLMLALGRGDVETSATLLLPSGAHSAALWVALQQLDLFAAVGWCGLALGAWKRGQTRLPVAVALCLLLWVCEAALRIGATLVIGAGMRVSLVPG